MLPVPRMGNRLCALNGTTNFTGVFLFVTVLLTVAATALLLTAVATDYWEQVSWNHHALRQRNVSDNQDFAGWHLEWLLDGQVVRLAKRRTFDNSDSGAIFLVPVYGGIWRLCPQLDDEQLNLLKRVGFVHADCINYLAIEDLRPDWQQRMQNLSIACTLVCLILLGCSALLGVFGILTNQISAVLVTGVMYLLAATFATFTLLLINFKRHDRPNGLLATYAPLIDGVTASLVRPRVPPPSALWSQLITARVVTTGWSLKIGWGGVVLCTSASIGWVFLSKITRQSPW